MLRMKITSTTLKQIAAMPAEAMAVSLLFLAGQLEQHERKQVAAAERQSRWRNAHNNAEVTPMSRESNADVTPLARVENKLLPFKQEGKKEEVLTLRVEPEGFQEFWAIYPKRLGDASRKQAVRAFGPALKRCDLKTILSGARKYADHCKATGKINTEFVKQARTWLNADGWTETYESAATSDFSSARLLLERIGRA